MKICVNDIFATACCYVKLVIYLASMDTQDLQSLCQTVLKEFDFILFHPMPEEGPATAKIDEEKMAYLEDEMVYKIVVLITMVVHKLQYQGNHSVFQLKLAGIFVIIV